MAFSMDESTAESVTASAPDAGVSADAKEKEDSFETNNQVSTLLLMHCINIFSTDRLTNICSLQVDGVDEGDIVKSDGSKLHCCAIMYLSFLLVD